MTAQLERYQAALKRARYEAYRLACAELGLDEPDADVLKVRNAELALCLAARDLARAVDDLPMERRPKGWAA